MPWLNSACFQIFLDEFAKVYPASLNILVLDNGRFHQAKSLQIPDNVVLLFLPPYSPELNPIERLWQDIKAKLFQNVFASIEEMQDKLTDILRTGLTQNDKKKGKLDLKSCYFGVFNPLNPLISGTLRKNA